jgi:hypothetical protein
MCKTKNEQTNKPSQCVVVCLYSEFFIGALTKIIKENGEGPWGGWVGSGVASGLSASSRLDANQSIN